MHRFACLLLLLLAACHPSIPQRKLATRAPKPANLPTLAPCALLHGTGDESLSNGAAGWFRGPWTLAYSTFLVRHPRGVVLIDASFGDTTNHDIDEASALFRWTLGKDARGTKPLATLLGEVGVRPEDVTHVLITHAHWDHTGGLPQVPNAFVLLSKAEADWTGKLEGHMVEGAMPHHLAPVRERLQPVEFDGPGVDGFPASYDVFGDGTIIAVPTPGHTPGATSWYVNSGDGHRWLFVGDAAWVKEGFTEPVTKGRLASLLSDSDRARTAEMLGQLHAIHEAGAATIVTSHDMRTWVDVPQCEKVPALSE